jgi:hypothetical protein
MFYCVLYTWNISLFSTACLAWLHNVNISYLHRLLVSRMNQLIWKIDSYLLEVWIEKSDHLSSKFCSTTHSPNHCLSLKAYKVSDLYGWLPWLMCKIFWMAANPILVLCWKLDKHVFNLKCQLFGYCIYVIVIWCFAVWIICFAVWLRYVLGDYWNCWVSWMIICI